MASSGWSSLSWYAGSAPGMWCLLGLRLVSLVQGKTYEIWLLFLDFPPCFAWKYSEGIKVESSILERHEWCHIKTPVEGAVRLSSLSCFKARMSMLTFPYDIHLPQLVGLLLSHRSQEDFFFFKKRMGGMTCSFQFASSSLLLTIIHLK